MVGCAREDNEVWVGIGCVIVGLGVFLYVS